MKPRVTSADTRRISLPRGVTVAWNGGGDVSPGGGMGVEFTNVSPQARVLLDDLLKRLLQ